MYELRKLKRFEKSSRKLERSGMMTKKIKDDLNFVINTLLRKEKLPSQYKDHKLKGKLKEYRECHVKGDILLLYRLLESESVLLLVDIGSHSELFN